MNQVSSDGGAPPVRLRHEAGLTAGVVMPLDVGAFQFGPRDSGSDGLGSGQPDVVRFELDIDSSSRVVAVRGAEPLAVEGTPVVDRIVVHPGEVIQLTTDHFVVETPSTPAPLPPPTQLRVPKVPTPDVADRRRLLWIFGLTTVVGLALSMVWPPFLAVAAVGAGGVFFTVVSRYLSMKRAHDDRAEKLGVAAETLALDLRAARSFAARELRDAHPGPAGISDLVTGRQPRPGAFDGRVSIASGDLGWTPPIDDPAESGWDHDVIVSQHNFLPAVPFTVDIDRDTIGIVGPRRSALAVARHLVTASMALTEHDALRVSVGASSDHQNDWQWLTGNDGAVGSSHQIDLFDGIVPSQIGPGTVIVAETIEELGASCGTTLIVRDDGTALAEVASIGAATGLVPYGITEPHAQSIVSALCAGRPELVVADVSLVEVEVEVDAGTKGDAEVDVDVEVDVEVDADTDVEVGPDTDVDVMVLEAEPTTLVEKFPVDLAPQPTTLVEELTVDLALPSRSAPFLRDRLMVVGEPGTVVASLVASAALAHAANQPDRPIFVLDRGDRSLVRLAQLPSCNLYAAIDDVTAVMGMLDQLEGIVAAGQANPALLVIADMDRALDFYRQAGLTHVAQRIESLLDSKPMYATASTHPGTGDLDHLVERFFVYVFAPSGDRDATSELRLLDEHGEHRVPESAIVGRDLTGSVAALRFGQTDRGTAS